MIVSKRFAATFVMTALVLGAGCSNECKDAAKKYTDIAASCGNTTVTYEFTARCGHNRDRLHRRLRLPLRDGVRHRRDHACHQ